MHIKEFSIILRENRKQRGISQSELAKKAGFTKRAIQYWEKGEKAFHLKTLISCLRR